MHQPYLHCIIIEFCCILSCFLHIRIWGDVSPLLKFTHDRICYTGKSVDEESTSSYLYERVESAYTLTNKSFPSECWRGGEGWRGRHRGWWEWKWWRGQRWEKHGWAFTKFHSLNKISPTVLISFCAALKFFTEILHPTCAQACTKSNTDIATLVFRTTTRHVWLR